LMFKRVAEDYGRGELYIAFNLIFFGLLLVLSDRACKVEEELSMVKKGHYKKAVIIGLVQSLALFPGVSRSGITISAGRFLKLGREEASRFSFLLSLPLIIGGAILKCPDLIHSSGSTPISVVLFGVFISFIVGILTIHYFLKIIKGIGLGIFGIYRAILALVILYFHFQA